MSAILSARDSTVLNVRGSVFSGTPYPTWTSGPIDGPVPGMVTSRASNATYFNGLGVMVTATSNVPRLDFNPGTGVPRGLLVEESRTNYLLNSAAPVTQTVSLSTGTYTLSVVGTGSCACAAGTAAGTGFGTATASTNKTFTVSTAGTVVFTVTGSLTRYQCENGTFPTSFISTAGASATRATDMCSVTPGSWFGSSAFSVEVEFLKPYSDTTHNSGPLYVSDGTNNNSTVVYVDTANLLNFTVATATVAQVAMGMNTLDTVKVNQSCIGYTTNDARAGYNGTLTAQDTSVTPPALTIIHLGNRFDGARGLNGWIRKVAFYAGRLPDSLLASLSNPA